MKYDGCEKVRVVRMFGGCPSVYDKVIAGDGTVLLEDYVGELKAGLLNEAAQQRLKDYPPRTDFRLVGTLSLEPLTEAKVDEREPQAAG